MRGNYYHRRYLVSGRPRTGANVCVLIRKPSRSLEEGVVNGGRRLELLGVNEWNVKLKTMGSGMKREKEIEDVRSNQKLYVER